MVSVWQRRRKSVVVGGVWPELGVIVSANEEGTTDYKGNLVIHDTTGNV